LMFSMVVLNLIIIREWPVPILENERFLA
jgi:hypothetical protein